MKSIAQRAAASRLDVPRFGGEARAPLPPNGTRADHVDYLIAGQRAPGSPKRTETLAGVNPPLDGPVVLLQDIIEVRHRPVLTAGVQRSFTLELSDRVRVSRMPIGVDDRGAGWFALPKALARKRFAAAASCLAESKKSIVVPEESTARYR